MYVYKNYYLAQVIHSSIFFSVKEIMMLNKKCHSGMDMSDLEMTGADPMLRHE